MYQFAANAVLLLHLLFIGVVLLGGLAVARWPRLAWIHLPAVTWGFLVEAMGWYCPLTDLENLLLRHAGGTGHAEDFLARTLLTLIYPEGLTRNIQLAVAAAVLVVNASIYGWAWTQTLRTKHGKP